jgi:hypothetical protein
VAIVSTVVALAIRLISRVIYVDTEITEELEGVMYFPAGLVQS